LWFVCFVYFVEEVWNDLKKAKKKMKMCEYCKLNPAIKNGNICEECFDKFITPLTNIKFKDFKNG